MLYEGEEHLSHARKRSKTVLSVKRRSSFVYRIDDERPCSNLLGDVPGAQNGIAQKRAAQIAPLVPFVDAEHPKEYCGDMLGNVATQPTTLDVIAHHRMGTESVESRQVRVVVGDVHDRGAVRGSATCTCGKPFVNDRDSAFESVKFV